MPRIQDVADVAGVSTATVSRALNNPDSVSEDTRETVIKAVEATGYRFNQAARNLRSNKTGAIVVLVPNLGNPFFSQILAGIEKKASAEGYSVLIADTKQPNFAEDRIVEYIRYNRADGLAVFDGSLPRDLFGDERAWHSGAPVVFACEWIDGLPVSTIRIDNRKGAEIAVEHLFGLGHRTVGHIEGPRDNILTTERLAGLRSTVGRLGMEFRDDWLFEGDFSIESGCRAGREWIKLNQRPTSMFCTSDQMALGFISELTANGFSVPNDVSVVGFDDIEIASRFIPPLTTIRQPREEIGTATAEILLGEITRQGKTSDCPNRILPVELIVRESTAALDR